ncbi:hypothetical protein GLOIN_2v1470780 [Rhizophagus irregularis DAOM 181602=DAOM 197198]|uniref:Uncharacterized protein n=1 Tax=Rhizophagus irregularis (strain DAOM 181602 / DAOM 197198 / MUCL 43194) TaxID=747089 RepID=A0A2P4QUT1_RHIID|nr:hypothetical protein GLOIN_2v1470780 [Rhizophagus irregularis DAOM 181602=DAOM 197198]POG81396.1 hypothetical protein GLOIN_2v1470780 [Rhizophagus irregularis DAOM 181602=DAOM 197198]|eukprot:XP_025188262.1 hypothetical protein GLOIN_2v1470780 [Rhizophagus irregularis DAOM 181602=DAOM 197198]
MYAGSSTTSKQKSKACWALHKSKIHQPDGGVIKESIKSAFQMNVLAENKKKEREKEIILDYFKIQMENQKCYSNLKLDEVLLNIYNRQTVSQSKNFQLVQENRYLKGQVARLERNNEELKKDKKPWHGRVLKPILVKQQQQVNHGVMGKTKK